MKEKIHHFVIRGKNAKYNNFASQRHREIIRLFIGLNLNKVSENLLYINIYNNIKLSYLNATYGRKFPFGKILRSCSVYFRLQCDNYELCTRTRYIIVYEKFLIQNMIMQNFGIFRNILSHKIWIFINFIKKKSLYISIY